MWKPELHPRDADGKFASRGGAAAKLISLAKETTKLAETEAHGTAHDRFQKAKAGGEPDLLGESRRLADAFHAGHTVDSELARNEGATVHRITLSDGTPAILKRSPPESRDTLDAVSQDHLGTLVARALGIDGVGSAKLDDDTTVTRVVPGISGAEAYAKGKGDLDLETETKRHLNLKNGPKIGLLDYVVNEHDRHSGNYMVDGDTVRPIDQGSSQFLPTYDYQAGDYKQGHELWSPFSREHLWSKGKAHPSDEPPPHGEVPSDELRSPFNNAELRTFYDRLKKLEPEFENEPGGTLKWQYAMSRLWHLLEATKGTS